MSRKNPPPPGIGHDASGGIWYYVWLKPNWALFVSTNELDQHMCYWPNEVIPKIGFHYGLSSRDLDALLPLYGAMPRGRVIKESYGDSFRIVHGGDFPSCLDEFEEQKRLRHKFGLMRRPILIAAHEHEMMIPRHMTEIKKIIGKVPY